MRLSEERLGVAQLFHLLDVFDRDVVNAHGQKLVGRGGGGAQSSQVANVLRAHVVNGHVEHHVAGNAAIAERLHLGGEMRVGGEGERAASAAVFEIALASDRARFPRDFEFHRRSRRGIHLRRGQSAKLVERQRRGAGHVGIGRAAVDGELDFALERRAVDGPLAGDRGVLRGGDAASQQSGGDVEFAGHDSSLVRRVRDRVGFNHG